MRLNEPNPSARRFAALLFILPFVLLLVAPVTASAKTVAALNAQDLRYALGQDVTGDQSKVAVPGDTIVLTAGTSYGGTFVLPSLSNPNGLWITIQSSALAQLPGVGQRVSPADASNMPKLVAPPLQPALKTAPGASFFKIIGVEFTLSNADGLQTDDGISNYQLVLIGDLSYTSGTQSPNNVNFDRCYVHGWPTRGVKRGIELHSKNTYVTGCYISDIHVIGYDSQGVAGMNGEGPFHINNNYVEAAGENVMFGGATPGIPGVVPSNIEVRGNYFFKPLSWRPGTPTYAGFQWTVKNLFELKSAINATVEGNVMENNWAPDYGAINLTVRHDSGSQATLQHITIKNNIVRHAGTAFRILGIDDPQNGTTVQGFDIKIVNNLFDDITADWSGQYGSWMWAKNINDLVIDHNTIFQNYWLVCLDGPNLAGKMTGFAYTNNIAAHGGYGINGQVNGGTQVGDVAIAYYLSTPTFNKNVFIDPGQHQSQYTTYAPTSSNYWPASAAAVYFIDYANHNYRLASNSPYKSQGSDGKDIGADFDAIEAAIANVGSAVVTDTFTDASNTLLSSHTGETGATWTKHPSYAGDSYISNANRMRGGGNSMYYASGVPATADYDVQADFCGMAQNASTTGIAGRVSTTSNDAYRVVFDVPNTGMYLLQKVNAGVVTQLQAIGAWQWGGNFADGSTHNVKLQMRGSSIKVFIDGVERMSVTDSSITAAGRAGVYTGSYSMTDTWGIHIDNFSVINAPPPAQFVYDTFTDTSNTLLSSHTGETGAVWAKHASYTGDSYISNANRMRGGGDSMYYASGVPASADYDVQADFCGMAQNASTPGIAGRASTTGDSAYRVVFDVPNTGKYVLQKVNAGVVTQLQAVGPWEWGGNFADGSTHAVKLQMRGASIKVFVDGVERMSVTDSSITTAGRSGVYTRSYSMTDTWGIHIDNFTATNAP